MTRPLPIFRWSDAPPDAVIMDIEGETAVAYSESTGRMYVLDPLSSPNDAGDPPPSFFAEFGGSAEDHAMSQRWAILFAVVVILAAIGCGVFLTLAAVDAIGRNFQ